MKSYAIANLERAPDERFFRRVERLATLGVDIIQLRAKTLPAPEAAAIARECRRRTAGSSTRLLINGRIDVAIDEGLDGVHLASNAVSSTAVRSAAPGLLVGRSCHSLDDVGRAAQEGFDYVLLGPVHPPRSKHGASGVSLEDLRRAVGSGVDVFALGGFSAGNLSQLRGVPVAGVAGITLYMEDEPLDRILEAVRAL
ncbi:MAG: thiamine phosphate synthase [Thermoanaerobaculia bacterium]